MTPIPYLLFISACAIAGNSALEETNTAVALDAAKDNPVLLKILQTVDAATNNERLFDVTLNLLKSLCVCMRETLRVKQMESFQLSREMKSLQSENDARESKRKVLDIYQKIYNKTCIDLREELALKVNKSGNLTPEEEMDFMKHSNCGKKAIDENTEDYERLTSQITQVDESSSNLRKILHTTFVTTRNYHKFHMRKFNLFKNSQKSIRDSVKHSIIVILTFYPHQNGTYRNDNFTEISSVELNTTMYSQSPIDIDIIDTRYGRRENSRDEDFIPKAATNCSLKSIYSFLLQSEQVNKTKVFKMLRKKGTIKVYIDIPTQINHIDYSKVCCSNETETPMCKIDFSRENFDSHEITTYLPKFKKRKKLHGDYKDTISKIKNLVQLYDRKLHGNKLNQLNLKTNKNNIDSKLNNIMTGVEKNSQATEKDEGDNIILSKDKYFKIPFRSKFNDLDAVTESVTIRISQNKHFKKQYRAEKYISPSINSSNESGMNTLLENTNAVDQNKSVLSNKESKVTNFTKLINSKKVTILTEKPVKTTEPVQTGLAENTNTNPMYVNDNQSTIQHIQKNTATENLVTNLFRYKTAIDFTEIFSDNANINNNTIDYSGSAKIIKTTGNYMKHKSHNKNREESSIKTRDDHEISDTIKLTQDSNIIYNTVIKNFDETNAVTTVQNTKNEHYEFTPERLNEKQIETRNQKLPNLLLIPTDKSFNMQQNRFGITDLNKILAKNHTDKQNSLRVKGAINSSTDYWNTENISILSDMKPVTTSLKTFESNITIENSITSLDKRYDANDLQSLVYSNKVNSLHVTKDQPFYNSAKSEIPIILVDNDIEEKSSFVRKPDEIKITENLGMTERNINKFDSFETTQEITTSTKNHSQSFIPQTTEAVINFQLLQTELENMTGKNNDEVGTFSVTNIQGKSTKKSIANHMKARNSSKNSTNTVNSHINEPYMTESTWDETETVQENNNKFTMTNIFNTTAENYGEKNTLTSFLQKNRDPNDNFHSAEQGNTNTKDYKFKDSEEIKTNNFLKVSGLERSNHENLTDGSSNLTKKKSDVIKTSNSYFSYNEENLNMVTPLIAITRTNSINDVKESTQNDEIIKSTNVPDTSNDRIYGIILTETLNLPKYDNFDKIKFDKGGDYELKEKHSTANTHSSYDAPIPKESKLRPFKSITVIDNEKTTDSVFPALKLKKATNSLNTIPFQNNAVSPKVENRINISTENLKVTTKPYSDHKEYLENSDTTMVSLVKKNSYLESAEIYTSAFRKTSTSEKVFHNRENLDEIELKSYKTKPTFQKTKENNSSNINKSTSFEIESQLMSSTTAEIRYNEREKKDSLTSPKTKLKFTVSKQPHENIDSFAMMEKLKSSKKNSVHSGNAEYQIKEDNISTLRTTALSNQAELLPQQILTMRPKIHNSLRNEPTTASSAKKSPEKGNGSNMVSGQQTKSDALTETTKLNDTTKRSTDVVAMKNTGNIQRELNMFLSDSEQYSSKTNKSRITRSTSAMKNPIVTYNQISSSTTTIPLSDNSVISFPTSALLHESSDTKAIQSPELSNDMESTLKRIVSQSPTTEYPDLNNSLMEVLMTPRTEKNYDISENDQKITTYIISPNVIQDTDTKKSIADLKYFTYDEALNTTSEERDDVKNIYNIVKTTILTNQTFIDTPFIFTEKNDEDTKERNEIGCTVASRLTSNSPQITTYNADNTLSKTPHDVNLKEKILGKDLKEEKNINDPEIKSNVTDKYVVVSLKPKVKESFEVQLIQSLQMLNFSESQNNSKSSSFERTNIGINPEAPSSLEDIHNDFKKILKFLNESSHTDQRSSSTAQNRPFFETKERLVNNLTITHQKPAYVINSTKTIPENIKLSGIQQEKKTDTLIFSKEITRNINTHTLSIVDELSSDLNTIPNTTEKLSINTKQSTKDETQTDVFLKIARPNFYKIEYLTQPITPNSTTELASSTDEQQSYRAISPDNKDAEIEQKFGDTKTSSFGDYLKITTPNFMKREHTIEILSDRYISIEFMKQNVSDIDNISKLKKTEIISNPVTEPQVTFNSQLNNLQPVEPFKLTEYNKIINTTKLTGPSKDFTSLYFIDSFGSSKEQNRGSEHDSNIDNITNITSTKYTDKVHYSETQNINIVLKNNQISDINDPKFEIAKENAHLINNLTSNNEKLDNLTKHEHKNTLKSVTEFDKYETLKMVDSTSFQDNFTTTSNILHDSLKTKVYNFTVDKTAFSTPTENTYLLQLSELQNSTTDDGETISNILKPSSIKTKKLGVTKIFPSSITYFTKIENTNPTKSYDLAAEIHENYRTENQHINNDVKASGDAKIDNEAEGVKHKLSDDLSTTFFYKTKISNGFEATEKVKTIRIERETSKNILEITTEPGLNAAQPSESIKTDSGTLISPLFVQVTEFSNFAVDKLDEAPVISNILKTSNAPKQTLKPNDFSLTDLPPKTKKSVIKGSNVNNAATKDLFTLENYSVGKKQENSSVINNVSHIADYDSANDKTHNDSSKELLSTHTNKTYVVKRFLSADVSKNIDTHFNVVVNKEEISKETKSHASATSENLRISQNALLKKETDLKIQSRTPNNFDSPDILSTTEDIFEGNGIISNLEKSSNILNQQQADIFDYLSLIKPSSNSGEVYIETHHTSSTQSKDRVERMNKTFKITKNNTNIDNIVNTIDVTVGSSIDNGLRNPYKELLVQDADKTEKLNALKSIKLFNDYDDNDRESGIFKNYLDITEIPRFEATLMGRDLKTRYHNLIEIESVFTTESATDIKNEHSNDVPLFNNTNISHFPNPQHAGVTHSLKENNFHSSELKNKFKSSIFYNNLELPEETHLNTTLTSEGLKTKYQNLFEKETVLVTPYDNHFIQNADNSTYIEYRHDENVTISIDVKTSHFPTLRYTGVSHNIKVDNLDSSEYQNKKQNKIESKLKDQDSSITEALKNDTKFALLNNNLVITEEPSFDAVLTGEDLETKYKTLLEKVTALTTPNESNCFNQTTESSTNRVFNSDLEITEAPSVDVMLTGDDLGIKYKSSLEKQIVPVILHENHFTRTTDNSTYIEYRHGENVTIYNDVKTSHFPNLRYTGVPHDFEIDDINSSEYKNKKQHQIESTMRDQDASIANELKDDTKSTIFNSALEKTEAPNFDATLIGGDLGIKYKSLSEVGTELTTSIESQFFIQTTESPTFDENKNDNRIAISKNENTLHYSSPQNETISHHLEIPELHSLENVTKHPIKTTLKDKDVFVNDHLKKAEETRIFNITQDLNYVTVDNLPENEEPKRITKFGVTTHDSQKDLKPINIRDKFDILLDITNEPVRITKEFNSEETLTKSTLKNISSQEYKVSNYSTENTKVIKSKKIQDNYYDLESNLKEETFYSANSVMLNSLAEKEEDVIITHNATEANNSKRTLPTDKNSEVKDNFANLEEIDEMTATRNEMVYDMAKKKIHEELSNTLSVTSSIETEKHMDMKSVVANKVVGDQPKIADNYLKITENPTFDGFYAPSLLNNLGTEAYNSSLLVTESTRQNPANFENTSFTETLINFSNEDNFNLEKNEHIKRISDTEKTSSFLNTNYNDRVSYAFTESLLNSIIRHDISTVVTVPPNMKHNMFKNENTETSDTGATNEILVHNIAENAIHKFGKSETMENLDSVKIYEGFDTQSDITDQQINVTEKSSLDETQKAYTFSESYNLFKYPQEHSTSKNVVATHGNRNGLETTIMEHTYHSQGDYNSTKGNFKDIFNQTLNYSDAAEYNIDTHFKLSNSRNAHLKSYPNTKKNVKTHTTTVAVVEETDKDPKVEHIKLTTRSLSNLTEQNKTGVAAALIPDALTLSKDDIMKNFKSVQDTDTSKYYKRSQKQSTQTPNGARTPVDNRVINESDEFITDMFAIIETATDSYDHFLDDLKFVDTITIDNVTDVSPASKNQTELDGQFKITGDKIYDQIDKMGTSLPSEDKLLENETITMKDNLALMAQLSVSESPKIPILSSTTSDQQNIFTNFDDNSDKEKNIVNSEFKDTPNITSITIINEPSKIKHIWSTSQPSSSIEISKTGSNYPDYLDNLGTITDSKFLIKVNEIEDTNATFYDVASDNFLLKNESTMSIEKKPTTNRLEINTKYENKDVADENVTATTEIIMSEVNITTVLDNKRIMKLLNKIRASFNERFKYYNELSENVEKNYLIETEPNYTDSKMYHENEPGNVFDGTEVTQLTEHENYPVTTLTTNLVDQLQSKSTHVINESRHNEIKLDEKNIFSSTKVNTAEKSTKYFKSITDINSDRNSIDTKLTSIQDYTYPMSSMRILHDDSADKFEETNESTKPLMLNTRYLPNINEHLTFDETPPANYNYKSIQTSTSYPSKTNMFNPVHNKTISQTPSHLQGKNISVIDLDTSQKRNIAHTFKHSINLRDQKITEPLPTYTEQTSELQLQNTKNVNESVTEVESVSIKLADYSTPKDFTENKASAKYNAEIKTLPENNEDYFVTNTDKVLSFQKNVIVLTRMETLDATEGLANELKLTTFTDSINSSSTLSMTNENIITKRNTKSNSIDESTLPLGKNTTMHVGTMLFDVPSLAFHVTDVKLEFMPTYNNNNPQVIPKLHGKFNISLNTESQHVTNSMNHNKTLDILNKAFSDQLHPTKSVVNLTHGSQFEEAELEVKTYIENAHYKVANNLPNLVKPKKEFLNNSISNGSESKIIKYFTAKNDKKQNINGERKDQFDGYIVPTDLVQYTMTDSKQQENTSLLLQSSTNLTNFLGTSSSLNDQNTVTDSYTFNSNETNILDDMFTLSNTTLRDAMNQVELNYNSTYTGNMKINNVSKVLNYDMMNSGNLSTTTKKLLTLEIKKTELMNNLTQVSQSRRYGDEYINSWPKANVDLVELLDNQLMDKNTSDGLRLIKTKVESNLNKIYEHTTPNIFNNENKFASKSGVIDGNELNSNFVPIKSKLIQIADTITTEIGSLSESATSNKNKTSLVEAYGTYSPNPDFIEEDSTGSTASTLQLSKSKWDISSGMNSNKLKSTLVPVIFKPLQDVGTTQITEKTDNFEITTPNQNVALLIYEFNKTNEINPADMKEVSTKTNKNTSQVSELKSNVTKVIDGNEVNNSLVPIISNLLHDISTMAITRKVNLPGPTTPTQDTFLFVYGHNKTNVRNPAGLKKESMQTTKNSSTFSESKPNVPKVIDSSKSNSILASTVSESLYAGSTMAITENRELTESITQTLNKILFVYDFNKTNVKNPLDITKHSIKTIANTPQISELESYTINPILLNTVVIVDKINKKKKNSKYQNAKLQPNKTEKIAAAMSTGKEHTLKTQGIELKSKVEKSPTNVNNSKNLPNIRKAFDTFTLTKLNTEQNTDLGVTNQKADILTSVDLNVLHTTASHNDRKIYKKKHLAKRRKHKNSKPKIIVPIDVKKENNFENSVTLTGKTERNLDPKVKYETVSSNQQLHITSKSLMRTTRKIKYNTYRPLNEEELDPPQFHEILSSFPKHEVKKVKTKNPQQVKNHHDTPYGNSRKYNTKQDLHNKSSIFDPLDKKNIYPVKKLISNPRKIIKRLKLANKRNDIVTMKTEDFFSRRLGVTRMDKLGEILQLYPKPVLKLQLVTTKPKSVILRPKFSSLNTLTKKPAIKKPVILQNMDIDYYRSLSLTQHRRSGPIRRTIVNAIPENLKVPPRIGFGDPVIESPYYIPTIMKPKFLRDRVDSIRSYIYNAEKKPNYRRHFLNYPGEGEDVDDSFVQYSKGNSRDEDDLNTPVHRITRPKKTIFFLSPTVPYNRYF